MKKFLKCVLGESNKLTCLMGCGIQGMLSIFKTKLLIYQSKAKLHIKILFGKITHF